MERVAEGTLFKNISLFGKMFEIRYGYYADYERENEENEPIPIYPDFLQSPIFTDDGYPFVTQMQTPCQHGECHHTDACCADCPHFLHGDELIGICRCEKNRRLDSA